MTDLTRYNFAPMLESQDGSSYGILAYEGAAPDAAIQAAINDLVNAGVSDWSLDDVIAKVNEQGYSCYLVHLVAPIYI